MQENKGFFPPAIYGLQGANFFKLQAQDKIRKPTRGFSVSKIPKAIFVIVLLLLWGQQKYNIPCQFKKDVMLVDLMTPGLFLISPTAYGACLTPKGMDK